jgi:hypothetical protein
VAPWQQHDYVKERLILNSFNAALGFARQKLQNTLDSKVVVIDRSGLAPVQLGIVNRVGGIDATIQAVAEQIAKQLPDMDQFQLLEFGTTNVVPRNKWTTRFLQCQEI